MALFGDEKLQSQYDTIHSQLQNSGAYTPLTIPEQTLEGITEQLAQIYRPQVERAIAQRYGATKQQKAAVDVDAASRGMGTSSFVTDAKNRIMDAEAADIAGLESDYASQLAGDALTQYQNYLSDKLKLDQYNQQLRATMEGAAYDQAMQQYQLGMLEGTLPYQQMQLEYEHQQQMLPMELQQLQLQLDRQQQMTPLELQQMQLELDRQRQMTPLELQQMQLELDRQRQMTPLELQQMQLQTELQRQMSPLELQQMQLQLDQYQKMSPLELQQMQYQLELQQQQLDQAKKTASGSGGSGYDTNWIKEYIDALYDNTPPVQEVIQLPKTSTPKKTSPIVIGTSTPSVASGNARNAAARLNMLKE